ncbi:MAG TPA: thioredoxin domain-containing protein [Pyrinomonadaceae bacterium]|nr:thioredoxin domain-containing protein [Pyrinomonadaceae bacterium]
MRKTVLPLLFAIISCAVPVSAQQPAAAAATPHPCGCEGEPQPEVLATVGGVKISRAEIDNAVGSRIEEARGQVVEARKRELDLQINSILLEAEAKKRGVSTTKLLEQEIVAKVGEPTEAEAQAFYNENKARIQQSAGRVVEFGEVKANVVEYLRGERQQQRAKQFAEGLRAAYPVTVSAKEATPPATPADRARVFATVNGRQITSAMIEDSLRPLIYEVQRRVYDLRRQQLELQVNDLLLSQEAQKRQLTPRALLDAEVAAKKKPVTDAEALAFYNENKARINGEFAQLKPQIVGYLEEQQQQQLSASLAERLRTAAGVRFFLREPAAPVYEIATDDQPSKGAATAAVTVVEFTDLQCPSCAAMHPVLERLAAEYGDRVRFVVRDYPLAQHADAQKAAEAAEAAREQGKYWEYVALLYRNQSALSVPKLKEYATQVGLDRAKFDAALDSGRLGEKVRRDVLDGNRVGVSGTPSFFVNGRFVEERSYEALKAAIEAALKTKG